MNFVRSFYSASVGLFALALCFVVNGCSKDSSSSYESDEERYYGEGKEFMDEMFHVYYWWYESIPATVSWNRDYFEYFYAHLVADDRWSWMETGDEWRNSLSGTVGNTLGIEYGQPVSQGDYDVYVRYVLMNSPMYNAGVRRGWKLEKIGNYEVSALIETEDGIITLYEEMIKMRNDYVFIDTAGNRHEINVLASTISTPTYLDRRIFTSEDYPGLDHKVGYLNYRTFVLPLISDITESFALFKTEGVSDLILDLRYNGGGSTAALDTLVGLIAPKKCDGDLFSVIIHNRNLSELNEECYYSISDNTLSLDRIFVITGMGTASASEVLINGLRSGIGKSNVITVGETTYGKPNGMYVFAYPQASGDDYYSKADYVFLPICFYTCNKDGEQIPDDGFVPLHYVPDDLYHDWGVGERLINDCLAYIANGNFPPETDVRKCNASGYVRKAHKIAREENAPGYGKLYREPLNLKSF